MFSIELEKRQIKFKDLETGTVVIIEICSPSMRAIQKLSDYLSYYKGQSNMATQDFKPTKIDVNHI